jgi:ADP-ribose pyrophosphatase
MRDVEGENLEDTGRRELVEEVGLSAGAMLHLIDMFPSPGMTDAVTSIFLATGCEPAERDLHGPEEQHSRVLHVPLVDALSMIERGEIVDSKSVVGLLLTQRRLQADSGR